MDYPPEYFYAKTEEDPETGCLLWTGAKYSNGYGHINWRGKNLLAHRVAWEYENGEPPPADLYVCHRCDRPECVEPSHLFLGTPKENQDDMYSKGRQNPARGSRAHNSKLKEEDVLKIKRRLRAGEKQRDIAKYYDVAQCTISNIKTGSWWGWLKLEEEQ